MKPMSIKRPLLGSLLLLLLCFAMLIGTTFAWFTDSVSSTGNKIQSGSLKLKLERLVDSTWTDITKSTAPLFDYALWEPGYTDYAVLRISNDGTLALKWEAKLIHNGTLNALADVIDVYITQFVDETPAEPADFAAVRDWHKFGTLRDFLTSFEANTKGNLAANESAYLGIALHMQESADNRYQDLDLGTFDLTISATQDTVEADGFYDNQYDAGAGNTQYVTTQSEFIDAITLGGKIVLGNDIDLTPVDSPDVGNEVSKDVVIDLNGYSLTAARTYANDNDRLTAVLTIANGANVTIQGNGSVKNNYSDPSKKNTFAIYITEGGKLTVNGGSYYGISDCIYVGGGDLTINAGTFASAKAASAALDFHPTWNGTTYHMYDPNVINCNDSQFTNGYATVTINGGVFINEDPSNIKEGSNASPRYNYSHLTAGLKTVAQDALGNPVADPETYEGDVYFVVVPA